MDTISPLTDMTTTQSVESSVTPVVIQTKEDVIERLCALNEQEETIEKQEIDFLKQIFYRLRNQEIEEEKKVFVENGGNEEEFVPETNEMETRFKELLGVIKEKRNALKAEEEERQTLNLEKKTAIIERMKQMTESVEDANKNYQEFKKLQAEWNEIKDIPATKANELWKKYQIQVEMFYDLIKLNNEFREYDFKKNLEIKTHLCKAAEKLAEEEEDVVSAFHQLQKLHQQFRETGPVAKDIRDEIWNRFKAASAIVNRRHQQYFEALKEREQRNLDEKTVICEIVESMEYDKMTTFQDWQDKTEEILALQAKWKTIGFAPQKMNTKIFERFRKGCDEFFKRKAEHFKGLKSSMSENLEKKRAMCEQAEALKDSTDWKGTSEALTRLQKEWKKTGPVSRKHSEAIWKRFVSACDYFFEQKAKATSSQKSEEHKNLELKCEIIAKLEEINAKGTLNEEESQDVRELMKEWNRIGFVPFKEKDKIYKQYRTTIDALFDKMNMTASQKKLSHFKNNISNKEGNLYREREKLVRAYDNMKSEIQTYENNIGFLTSSSKKGNSLVTEMNRKIEKLRAELELIQQKINVIDESIG